MNQTKLMVLALAESLDHKFGLRPDGSVVCCHINQSFSKDTIIITSDNPFFFSDDVGEVIE